MSRHTQFLFSVKRYYRLPVAVIYVFALLLVSCNNGSSSGKDIVNTPEQMDPTVSDRINEYLSKALPDSGRIDDTIILKQTPLCQYVYEQKQMDNLWSSKENWLPGGEQLISFIENARLYGLFPEDYHIKHLLSLKGKFFADSLGKTDRANAALWARADIMLTDAFIQLIKDVKLGRLKPDSVTTRKDSVLPDEFYVKKLNELQGSPGISKLIESLEPANKGYHKLKDGIKTFLDSADFTTQYSFVPYPYKDTVKFRKALQQRLYEDSCIGFNKPLADSVQLAAAVKKYQQLKGLKADGKAGEGVVRSMNSSDREKFIRIAITMDRYKLLDETMPRKYIWVNLPSYQMQMMDGDSAKITSRVIVGKPATRTPVLTSAVNELVIYPTWTPPTSIIIKEILPAVKRNPGYLAKRGFSLVNGKGETIDPYSVDWSKYTKKIPYRIVQGSGDANALGIMKFNFPNKYAVYLHDTNQRYLFGNSSRAMSHGCVRVQEWEKLTYYILRNDSLNYRGGERIRSDSVRNWLIEKKFKKIPVQNKIPVYLRYFTCEGKNGKIIFYDDIYGEDRKLREQYFADK